MGLFGRFGFTPLGYLGVGLACAFYSGVGSMFVIALVLVRGTHDNDYDTPAGIFYRFALGCGRSWTEGGR